MTDPADTPDVAPSPRPRRRDLRHQAPARSRATARRPRATGSAWRAVTSTAAVVAGALIQLRGTPSRAGRRMAMPAPERQRVATWQRRTGMVGAAAVCLGVAVAGLSPVNPDAAWQLSRVGAGFDAAGLEADGTDGLALSPAAGLTLASRPSLVPRKTDADPFADADVAASTCVAYPLTSYRLTSPYGMRVHPIFGGQSMHYGTDFAAPLGTPIHAVADGTVVYSGPGRLGRSDELVIIEHEVGGEHFYSWYVHMYRDGIFVEIGDDVLAGDVVAEVGNNGNSTGPHLHLEIHTSDPGVGLPQKNSTVRNASSVVYTTSATPTSGGEESSEPSEFEPSEAEPSPSQPEPSESEPSESEPSPSEPEPEPSTEEEPTTDEPTDEPDPTEEPSEDSSEEPTDESTDEPSEEPTEEEPSPEERETVPEDFGTPDTRERVPFPTRASGTTVDPIPFLESLGLSLLPPQQCAAQR